jgi:hypothetical protein
MSYVGNAPYQGVVDTGNIVDSAVTSAKIAPDTVVASDIAAGAVGNSELAADAVTADKIATGAVGSSELASGAAVANIGYTPYNATNPNSYIDTSGARAAVSAGTGISYSSSTGVIASTITQYTDALARSAHSFTAGSGGYNSTTGVITIPTNTTHLTNGSGYITGNQNISVSGDISGSGTTSISATLATVNSNVGSFGSATSIPVVTVNAKGLITAVSTATVAGGQYFGSASTKAIAYNANSISENITITAGNNGLSAGPITISTGYTVVVETGANWVIV